MAKKSNVNVFLRQLYHKLTGRGTRIYNATGSTCIQQVEYHNGKMRITFNTNKTYEYEVPLYVYEALKNAPSRGSYFMREIRPVYPGKPI